MATVATREQFKEYCLRRLGSPVIDINVDDEQIEDRIDDALQYYQDYHFDGTELVYLSHQLPNLLKRVLQLHKQYAAPYNMEQHIAWLEETFVGKQPIRYNRHVNQLHIDNVRIIND